MSTCQCRFLAFEEAEKLERFFPGLGNSIRTKVRYSDDFALKSIDESLVQFVVLGAGYVPELTEGLG